MYLVNTSAAILALSSLVNIGIPIDNKQGSVPCFSLAPASAGYFFSIWPLCKNVY